MSRVVALLAQLVAWLGSFLSMLTDDYARASMFLGLVIIFMLQDERAPA